MAAATIFEFHDPIELLRGWLLHAHKGRDRHDTAARVFDQRRYFLGVSAAVASAIVGTSVFDTLQRASPNVIVQFAVGAMAICAVVLTSVQTALDYGARAERHRIAGVRYKEIIRHVERMRSETTDKGQPNHEELEKLQNDLNELEEAMPVVPASVFQAIETKYRHKNFVNSVLEPQSHSPERAPNSRGRGGTNR